MCGLGCTLKKTRVGRKFFTFFLEYSDLLGHVLDNLVIILVVHQTKGAGTQHSKIILVILYIKLKGKKYRPTCKQKF